MLQSFAIIALASYIGTAGPGGQAPSGANAACLTCHGAAAKAEDRLKINETLFSGSVHRDLRCTECHLINPAEKEGDLPHRRSLPDVNCTAACHQEDRGARPGLAPLAYPDSVHGRAYLERGNREVAKCWDCHGKHNIRRADDPESSVFRTNIPRTCSTCHEDMSVVIKYHIHSEMPYQEYMKSVHGKALFQKGLLHYAAVCTDCHGVHNIQGVGEPHLMAKDPVTCGRCHELIFGEYKDSIHGRQALAGNPDSPLCVDCHGEHGITSPQDKASPAYRSNVPDTCSLCHARPEIMRKYGISEDKIVTFIDSLHGIAVGYGSRAAANCASCHGVHDIRPAAEPQSKVNPRNLRSTCGQAKCHPGMPARIATARIHIGPEQKNPKALFYVQRILLILVAVLLIFTVVWLVPGFIKKIRLLKK